MRTFLQMQPLPKVRNLQIFPICEFFKTILMVGASKSLRTFEKETRESKILKTIEGGLRQLVNHQR